MPNVIILAGCSRSLASVPSGVEIDSPNGERPRLAERAFVQQARMIAQAVLPIDVHVSAYVYYAQATVRSSGTMLDLEDPPQLEFTDSRLSTHYNLDIDALRVQIQAFRRFGRVALISLGHGIPFGCSLDCLGRGLTSRSILFDDSTDPAVDLPNAMLTINPNCGAGLFYNVNALQTSMPPVRQPVLHFAASRNQVSDFSKTDMLIRAITNQENGTCMLASLLSDFFRLEGTDPDAVTRGWGRIDAFMQDWRAQGTASNAQIDAIRLRLGDSMDPDVRPDCPIPRHAVSSGMQVFNESCMYRLDAIDGHHRYLRLEW